MNKLILQAGALLALWCSCQDKANGWSNRPTAHNNDTEPFAAPATSETPALAGKAAARAKELTDIESQAQQAMREHPEGEPECGPGVTGPCVHKWTSEIGQLEGATWSRGDQLPPALHGHGEALRAGYVAPDGTEFLSGYMYTGAPGPDTGVVYRKDPGGVWKIVYSKRENELGYVWGRSSTDVWASGVTTLAHWDGTAWREEPIPDLQGHLGGVWGDGAQLFVVSSDWQLSKGTIYRRDTSGKWIVDGTAPAVLFTVGGVGSTIYAVGLAGTIWHRTNAGTWTDESTNGGQMTNLYAANARDIYIAGDQLVHSNGDGTWYPIKLPTEEQVTNVWGRGANDVFAGTMAGVFHWDGKRWSATGWTHETEAIAGNAQTLLVANQHM